MSAPNNHMVPASSQVLAESKTPFFVFYPERFRKRFEHFSKFGVVYYPVKANDRSEVIGEVRKLGGRFEVDSQEHIERLLAMGVSPLDIQSSIPVRSPDHLRRAVECGIQRFVVDSEKEFRKIAAYRSDSSFIVRLSVMDTLDLTEYQFNKWGVPVRDALVLADKIEAAGCRFLGISYYLPQDVYSPERFVSMLDAIADAFQGRQIEVLDVGGGLDDSHSSSFSASLQNAKSRLGVSEVVVEPGRNMLDPCIDMIASVIGLCKRGRHWWIYLDVGVYSGLLDKLIKHRHFRIDLFPYRKWERRPYTYMVSGPTSDTLDYLGEHRFGSRLQVGDRVIIRQCGAYSYVLRTHFCGLENINWETIP